MHAFVLTRGGFVRRIPGHARDAQSQLGGCEFRYKTGMACRMVDASFTMFIYLRRPGCGIYVQALIGAGLGKDVALVTDGRFSGASLVHDFLRGYERQGGG